MPSDGSISNWILLVWSVPVLPVCQDSYSIRIHFAAWKPECFFSGNFNRVFIFYALKKASHICTAKLLPIKIILITFFFFLFVLPFLALQMRQMCEQQFISQIYIFTQYALFVCILLVMHVLSVVCVQYILCNISRRVYGSKKKVSWNAGPV